MGIILVAWGVRLMALARQDIWWDEARNIDVALRPFLQVATAPELDIHPPVYFWLLHGWARISGINMDMQPMQIAFITRLMSVMAGVVSVALLYQLGRRVALRGSGVGSGMIAALLGAGSPFWLAESQETRMYTVGFALLLAAAVALLEAWQCQSDPNRGKGARGPLVWFVLLSVLALLSHYNAVFIVAAWYGGWLVFGWFCARRRVVLMAMVVCAVATVMLVAPIAPIALRQIPGYENPNLAVPSIWSYLQQNWRAYWGGYAFVPEMGVGLGDVWLWFVAVVGSVGVIAAWLQARNKTPLSFLLLWLIGGLALYYVAVVDRGAFNVRYSSFVTPALYVLMGVALSAWGQWWRGATVGALLLALALWPQAVRADLYDDRFAREDIAGVTRWLRENVKPGAVVFVDQKYPFGLYYDRYVIDPDAEPMGDETAPARYLFVDINTIDVRLQEWAGDATEVYWVQWFESDTDPRRAVAFLLDQQGERGGEQNFQGYSIDWWRLTPPNEFLLAPTLTPLEVSFDAGVRTVEASLPSKRVEMGGYVPVVIRWAREPGGEVARPLKARVALYDADGNRISQRDERILSDRHLLPAEWTLDEQPLNVYLLDLPEDATPGEYQIGLLVYDADTLDAFGILDAVGNPTGIEAMIGSVEVVAPH